MYCSFVFFFFQAEDGIRDLTVTGVQTCALPIYQEVFGPDPTKCGASLSELAAAVRRLRPLATGRARLGVSPHAPYTVSEPLYRATAELARRERLPVAVHLAESREETALVRDGAGPFADGLRARGIPVPAHNCTPVQYLSRLGGLQRATGWPCIHCLQVDGPAIEWLRNAGAPAALCPRSHHPAR